MFRLDIAFYSSRRLPSRGRSRLVQPPRVRINDQLDPAFRSDLLGEGDHFRVVVLLGEDWDVIYISCWFGG